MKLYQIFIISLFVIFIVNCSYKSIPETNLEIIQEKIIGQWEGNVTTPWVDTYSVEIEFRENGTYSAHNTSSSYPAFYYGTDDESNLKTYYIYDLYTSGEAVGSITIFFDVANTTIDKLDFVSFSNNYNSLTFEFWHNAVYGPIEFNLVRE